MSSGFFRRIRNRVCGGVITSLFLLAMSFVQAGSYASFAATHSSSDPWWKHAVVYEIYPRSFQDSNGDGIGDLNGITSRLGYLQGLGIDAIWLSPMYPSPQVDFGYDVSNYEDVDPKYGTLADFDRLVAEGRKHNIRVVIDMVLNHTSDKHEWFIEACKSRTNPKHDWYVWSDGKPGTGKYEHEGRVPPNNWISGFGGSAWEWVPAVHQFYYHKFYKQQPDLNWRNPAVEKAIFDTMRFWLDRGVAGFRLDAVPTLFEDAQQRDERDLGGLNAQGDPNLADDRTANLPEIHDVLKRMRTMVASYPGDRVLIGETYLPNTAELDKWYGGEAHNELNLPMDLLVGFRSRDHDKLDVDYFRARLDEVETQVHGSQPLLVFDNHDNPRAIDRYGDGTHNVAINKVLDTVLFTSRATAMTYYGEEIGMLTTTPTRREDVKDPIGITGWPNEKGRDGERTPMQWNAGPQAGFSTNPDTWLPIPPSYKEINVAVESKNPDSQLNWFKQLIALRRTYPALRNGSMTMLNTKDSNVLTYLRQTAGAPAVLVAVNFTAESRTISIDPAALGSAGKHVKTLATTDASLASTSTLKEITLPPYASWIASVQ